jgi:phosphoribosyl 1,2-cyclic phosphodiesterase
MLLKILGSNSAGNCYILESTSETLIIEAGVGMKQIVKGLNFNLLKVKGCLITHSHQDHCKSALKLMQAGVNTYMTRGEASAINLPAYHHRLAYISAGNSFFIGNFQVMPFAIKHDTPEPVGFLIKHEEIGTTLFLTDSYYSQYKFPALNNIILECNYDLDIINANETPQFLKDRIFQSHMNLKTCKELLAANDLTSVNNIVIIHLSNTNSDADRFKKEISDLTGKTITIADAGMTIQFDKFPI